VRIVQILQCVVFISLHGNSALHVYITYLPSPCILPVAPSRVMCSTWEMMKCRAARIAYTAKVAYKMYYTTRMACPARLSKFHRNRIHPGAKEVPTDCIATAGQTQLFSIGSVKVKMTRIVSCQVNVNITSMSVTSSFRSRQKKRNTVIILAHIQISQMHVAIDARSFIGRIRGALCGMGRIQRETAQLAIRSYLCR